MGAGREVRDPPWCHMASKQAVAVWDWDVADHQAKPGADVTGQGLDWSLDHKVSEGQSGAQELWAGPWNKESPGRNQWAASRNKGKAREPTRAQDTRKKLAGPRDTRTERQEQGVGSPGLDGGASAAEQSAGHHQSCCC